MILEGSQNELREALQEEPEEVEFNLAIEENENIILLKKDKIRELKRILELIDPAYYAEHYNNTVLTISDTLHPLNNINNNDNIQSQEEGIYL